MVSYYDSGGRAIAAVSCESEKPTPTAALAARSAAATRLTQADRGERVALVAGAGEAMVAVKLVGPDIDNLTIDNLTLTTTILEVKQKALAAMPAGGPTSLPQLRILYQGRFMDDQKTLKGARPRRGRLPQPTAPQRELQRLAASPQRAAAHHRRHDHAAPCRRPATAHRPPLTRHGCAAPQTPARTSATLSSCTSSSGQLTRNRSTRPHQEETTKLRNAAA